jgi:hypothetical protein
MAEAAQHRRDPEPAKVEQDRVSLFTRALSVLILPFLVVASCLLYLAPGDTDRLFAWTIVPPLTAMYLASAYLGGVWFFARVLRVHQWQRVRYGFPAVLTFAALLGIATLLHWEKFHAGHISFVAWATLYFTTPFLVAAAMVVESRIDGGSISPPGPPGAWGWGGARALLGLTSLGIGVTLFLVPSIGVDTWAWELTPLTARVLGATLTLPGMVNLWFLIDARWGAFRILFQAQLVSLCFILGALLIGWSQLDFSRLAAWLVVPGLAGTLILYALFYRWNEVRARRGMPVTAPPVNPRSV